MANDKLGRASKEKMAVMRNQVSYLLWNGKLETTVAKAKSVQAMTDKILTYAINSYTDTVKVQKTITDDKGVKSTQEVLNDGPKKLAARRKIMSKLYDLQEVRKEKETLASYRARTKEINHPLIEKIFNEYAPKYDERAKASGNFGGYSTIAKLGARRGDAAAIALVTML